MFAVQKELSRPPVYNPEDYAISLKKWIDKPSRTNPEKNEITTQIPSIVREMSLKQFSSISDLLNKLKTDLRSAYTSFVQEFVADPIDGVSLLMQLLGTIHSSDAYQQNKVPAAVHRKSLLDENTCLQCLRHSLRCPETMRRLTMSSLGLFSLTVCIMSNVNKSRIITLELLTKICCYSINGHIAVSEAMSTMRLRFAEPIRFRFLIGMINSAAPELLISGLRFLNTFLETSPKKQTQLYIQAELEQAGFSIKGLKETLSAKDTHNEAILKEFNRWSNLYIDVEVMKNNFSKKCKELSSLKEQILRLESQIQILQKERIKFLLKENAYKEETSEIDYTAFINANSFDKSYSYKTTNMNYAKKTCENSTPAEDEGISSSDQDDCCEENSSSTFVSTENCLTFHNTLHPLPPSENIMSSTQTKTANVVLGKSSVALNKESSSGGTGAENFNNREKRVDVSSRSAEVRSTSNNRTNTVVSVEESDIIPSKILPKPPKKSRSFHFLNENFETNPFYDDESVVVSDHHRSVEGNSTPPSATRLAYSSKKGAVPARNNGRSSGKTFGIYETSEEYSSDFAKPNMLKRSKTFHHLQNQISVLAGTSDKFKKKKLSNNASGASKSSENRLKLDMANKSYVLQNKDNFNKELQCKKNYKYTTTTTTTTAASAAPPPNPNSRPNSKPAQHTESPAIINSLKSINFAALSINEKTNTATGTCYNSNKRTVYYADSQQRFSLKKQNNAGIYSDKNNQQHNRSTCNASVKQVPLVNANFPRKYLDNFKHQANYKGYNDKITDLSSGLY